jgi:hypothetical protein
VISFHGVCQVHDVQIGSTPRGATSWQITVVWYKPQSNKETAVIPGPGEPFEAVELGYLPDTVYGREEPPEAGQLIEVWGYIVSSVGTGQYGLYKKARFHVEKIAKVGPKFPLFVNIEEHIKAVGRNSQPLPG